MTPLLLVIAVIALVAIVACALGQVWGPLVIALGLAGWAAFMLLSGFTSPGPEVGLLALGGSVAEFAAASEFWDRRGARAGAPLRWRATATLVGAGGSLLVVVSLGVLASAAIGAWSLDAPPSGAVFPSPPVVLHARGEASARLDGVTGFTTHTGSADCTSPGSQVVVHVEGWDMGALGDATFRGEAHIHVAGLEPNGASVLVYFWSSSMTGAWPTWGGPGQLVTDEPSGGRVTFEGLGVWPDHYAAGWPNELSGEISWSCGPWSSAPATYGP